MSAPTIEMIIWRRLCLERDRLVAAGVDVEIAVREAVGIVEGTFCATADCPSCQLQRDIEEAKRERIRRLRDREFTRGVSVRKVRQPVEVAA